jgi:hypothetical protein
LVGARDQGPAVVAEATDQRLRAFTLMLRTYEEARAAIGYLRRREEDAESIAPTLYPGKGKRRSSEPELPPATQPPTGSAPVSADITQPIPVVTPAQIAAANAAAAQKGAPASKDPFLS